MPKKMIEQPQEKKEISLNLPESCLACRTLNVATFPVRLTQLDGSVITVCQVARCVNCGTIKHYGIYSGIFKLNGKHADFNMQYWPELKRNGIRASDFEEAVLEASREKDSPIWLDARNGLKPAEPEGNYKQIMKKWEGLLSGRSRLGFN